MYKIKLLEMGIPAHYKGFTYLNKAMEIYEPLKPIMEVYAEVAEEYSDTVSRVERAMRHAISHSKDVLPVGQFIAKYKILMKEG